MCIAKRRLRACISCVLLQNVCSFLLLTTNAVGSRNMIRQALHISASVSPRAMVMKSSSFRKTSKGAAKEGKGFVSKGREAFSAKVQELEERCSKAELTVSNLSIAAGACIPIAEHESMMIRSEKEALSTLFCLAESNSIILDRLQLELMDNVEAMKLQQAKQAAQLNNVELQKAKELDLLKEQLISTEQKLKIADTENENLKHSVREWMECANTARESALATESVMADLPSMFSKLTTELKDELNNERAQKAELLDINQKLTAAFASSEESFAALAELCASQNQELQHRTGLIGQYKQDMEGALESLKLSATTMSELGNLLRASELQLTETRAELVTTQADLAKANDKLANLEATLKLKDNILTVYRSELSRLASKSVASDNEMNDLRTQLAESQATINGYKEMYISTSINGNSLKLPVNLLEMSRATPVFWQECGGN